MKSPQNDPRDHHYTPVFYQKPFARVDDENKIDALWKQNPFVLGGSRSIANIAFERDLYTLTDDDGTTSVETLISRGIEAPLTSTDTWRKVLAGDVASLTTPEDKLNLYVLIRHLEFRNLETLRFMEGESARIRDLGFPVDYTPDERRMHTKLAKDAKGVERHFLSMVSARRSLLERFADATICVMRSSIRLRTASRPVIEVPRRFADLFGLGDEVKWLALTPELGMMLSFSPGTSMFTQGHAPLGVPEMMNRLYLVQLLNGLSVRYCFASDELIEEDLRWAGYAPEAPTKRGIRFKRTSTAPERNWLEMAWDRQEGR